ncbi:MAG: hypothetical protein ACREQQ_17220 [Candidatus Binatia bacterium]
MRVLAVITGCCMVLGTYFLVVFRRRLGLMLEDWGREPVDRFSPVLPGTSE